MAEVRRAILKPQREIGDSIEHTVQFLDSEGDEVVLGDEVGGSYVPTTRTVNTKALSSDVVLNGADVVLTGLSAGTKVAVTSSDTVNQAVAKLVAYISDLEDRIETLEA